MAILRLKEINSMSVNEREEKAKELNLDLNEFLNTNNTLPFFEKTEDGIETGRLPSNVSDLMIILKK